MKIRFIEDCGGLEENILTETENIVDVSAMFNRYTQIQITKEEEILWCNYLYNVFRVVENQMDIFVEINDRDNLKDIV